MNQMLMHSLWVLGACAKPPLGLWLIRIAFASLYPCACAKPPVDCVESFAFASAFSATTSLTSACHFSGSSATFAFGMKLKANR